MKEHAWKDSHQFKSLISWLRDTRHRSCPSEPMAGTLEWGA
jgi:hypothetical protein